MKKEKILKKTQLETMELKNTGTKYKYITGRILIADLGRQEKKIIELEDKTCEIIKSDEKKEEK